MVKNCMHVLVFHTLWYSVILEHSSLCPTPSTPSLPEEVSCSINICESIRVMEHRVCFLHVVVQEYSAAVAGIVTVLIIFSDRISVIITCVCIYGARSLCARRSSSQHEQSTPYANNELYCQPAELSVCGMPGSTGNLSLFSNEAYEQLQRSTPINFIQEDDDVYEKLPELD